MNREERTDHEVTLGGVAPANRVAAFLLSAADSDRYRAFISPRGQLLNQSPELRDC